MAIHTSYVAVLAIPISFSDSALLIPIQTTMIAAIYKDYDREISQGFLLGAVEATKVSTIEKVLQIIYLK